MASLGTNRRFTSGQMPLEPGERVGPGLAAVDVGAVGEVRVRSWSSSAHSAVL